MQFRVYVYFSDECKIIEFKEEGDWWDCEFSRLPADDAAGGLVEDVGDFLCVVCCRDYLEKDLGHVE